MGIRYLRAVQGRFSVNLRMIPVISCLENRAVALMLHCLSRPFPLPPPPLPPYAPRNVLLPVHSHYFNYERPQWLSSSGRIPQPDLLGGEKMGREGEKGREKNERAPSPLPPHLHSNYANIGQIARRVNRLDDRFRARARMMLLARIYALRIFFPLFFFVFCTRRPRFSDDPIFIYTTQYVPGNTLRRRLANAAAR